MKYRDRGSQDRLRHLIHIYQEGMTLSELAGAEGISIHTLRTAYLSKLHDAGIRPNSDKAKSINRLDRRDIYHKDMTEYLRSCYEPGMTEQELADRAGVTRNFVQKHTADLYEQGIVFGHRDGTWSGVRRKIMEGE